MDFKKCPWCKRLTYSANVENIKRCETCGQDITNIPIGVNYIAKDESSCIQG